MTQAVFEPEMPPRERSSTCPVCQLLQTDFKLWVSAHEAYFLGDKVVTHVVKFFDDELGRLSIAAGKSEPQKIFTYKNVYAHFNQHVPTQEIFNRTLKGILRAQNKSEIPEELNQYHEELINKFDIEFDAVDEFIQLRDLVKSAECRLIQMDSKLKEMENKKGYVVDFNQIAGYQKLVSENLKNRKELLTMQNNMGVAGNAVEAAIAAVAKAFMGEAVLVAEEAKAMVLRENPISNAATEIETLVRTRLGDTLKGIMQEAHKVVIKQYGIG